MKPILVRHRYIDRPNPPAGQFRGSQVARGALPPGVFASLGTCCVDTTERVFSLTYDDGPSPAATPRVLDALAAHDATATFFVLGSAAARHPALLRRIAEAGHELAVHGMDHRSLLAMSAREAEAQIRASCALVEEVTGRAVTLYRPTYGKYRLRHVRLLRRLGLELVLWSGDAIDWAGDSADDVVERTTGGLFPGSVVLLHDARGDADPPGSEAPGAFDRGEVLDRILRYSTAKGYRTLTVTELLNGRSRVISLAPHRMVRA